MQFTLIVLATRNFRVIDLMNEYAKNTPGVTLVRDQYFNNYICRNCVWYIYDHWEIETDDDHPDTIKVTVFLKEKTQ